MPIRRLACFAKGKNGALAKASVMPTAPSIPTPPVSTMAAFGRRCHERFQTAFGKRNAFDVCARTAEFLAHDQIDEDSIASRTL
jgi:hypothetical protein